MTTTVNTPDMRAALIEARDWFESQAKAVSKGCGSSYELHDLRMQRDALDAALAAAAPAQAGEYPPLVCDYCGALTPDPWHSSGMLHGKMSKHIHSCDACAARADAQAAHVDASVRHQDEAWRHWKSGDLLRVTKLDNSDPFEIGDLVTHDDRNGNMLPFVKKGSTRHAMDAARQLEFVSSRDAARAAQGGHE